MESDLLVEEDLDYRTELKVIWYYKLIISTNAHNVYSYTSKSTKIHIKTLNTYPYMFRSLFSKPFSGGLVDCTLPSY
jgi:hypothetical protein